MSEYVYQFDDAALLRMSKNFETRVGDNSGEHQQDYFDTLRLLLAIYRDGSFLDIGAGVGRVTAIARDMEVRTVALEPDGARWEACHQAFHQLPDCDVRCQTTSAYIDENPGTCFDLAVIGMVLQHISTHACEDLLRDVATLLRPGGLAIIYTTHTLEETRGFSFSGDPEKNFYVSEQAFNAYIEADPGQQDMGLPVRRFSKSDLLAALPANLQSVYWRQTSYYRPHGLKTFSARLGIEPEKLRDTGHNQFIVVQKSA